MTTMQLDWEKQTQRMLSLINIARVTILFSLMIFLVVVNNLRTPTVTTSSYAPLIQNQYWLYLWCFVYGVLILFSITHPNWALQKRDTMPNISSVLDISMIALLVFFAGGVRSGFGILVLPFLATSCLLSYGRFPLVYGSYASLLVIGDILLQIDLLDFGEVTEHFTLLTSQLLLIAACYLVPLLTSFSAEYLAHANIRIQKHQTAFERISGLNQIVLNRVQEGVIVLDTQCRIWLFNHQAQQIFSNLVVGNQINSLNTLVQIWRKGPATSFENSGVIGDVPMHIRAIPLLQKDTELLMLFIRPEHERQREAQTVKLASLGLLTANLAHEIRNPLSAMRHANDLLSESDAYHQPMITRLNGVIEKNIARIDKMIEDVSALNKRDQINTQYIDLMKFWLHFIQEFKLTRPESAGCIKLDMRQQNLAALFDPMHLQQILWNLCNNAWRHSEKQKDSVIVRIEVVGKNVSLQVWDDGPGVSPTLLPHLFEPFQTTQSEGTGLGLYVARELAHANRGDLQYNAPRKAFELIMPRKYHEQK